MRDRKTRPARLERRVRVTFFLPVGTKKEHDVVLDVISYLNGQVKNPALSVTGFTHSSVNPENPVFHGHWWSKMKGGGEQLTVERVILFLIDYLALAEEWKFDAELVRLKKKIHTFYARHRCKQEEVWMIKEDIHRYA